MRAKRPDAPFPRENKEPIRLIDWWARFHEQRLKRALFLVKLVNFFDLGS
jgi:hypothetical protein